MSNKTSTVTLIQVEKRLIPIEYLTEKESAEYCRVSLTNFRARAADYNIKPGWAFGKKLYRVADLKHAVESAWQL